MRWPSRSSRFRTETRESCWSSTARIVCPVGDLVERRAMSGLVRGRAGVQGAGQDVREPLHPFAHLYGGRHVKSAPRRDRFHAARAGCPRDCHSAERQASGKRKPTQAEALTGIRPPVAPEDRKSTRLNSSHSQISYAVFCLKKKKKKINRDSSKS